VADIFEALSAPARRAILDELRQRDGQSLFELCSRLTMNHGLALTRQAFSQHIEVLESAGLVTTRREGRYKFHHLDTTPLREIARRWGRATRRKRTDEDRSHQRVRRRPGEGAPLLHGRARLREEG
jgi:DNA-binding transcriptional ArsR family regulator